MQEGSSDIVLQGRELTKRFGDFTAVDRVTVSVRRKEIGALLGENGAGKSTYLKMLNGYLKPNSGSIFYNGQEIRFTSAHDASRKRIYTIYQSFALIDKFTVKENLELAFPEKSASELNEMTTRYGKALAPDVRVALLPAGVKQRLEIVKALESDAKVLLLDEPTSVLAYEERDRLFKDLAKLGQEKGMAVLITTHKLQDVIDYCGRVAVMKTGKLVMEKLVSDTSMSELTAAMFGAEEVFRPATESVSRNEADKVLEVRNLSVRGDNVPVAVHDATFSMFKGEIVGIIGIAGNGQVELADAIYGLRSALSGAVTPSDAVSRRGRKLVIGRVAFVSDDPVQVGLAAELSVKENFGISIIPQLSKGAFVDWRSLESFADAAIARYEIKCSSTEAMLRDLSGGNVQKVLVAREFERKVDLLVAIHPARGLDLHTTHLVYRNLREIARNGVSVLLISEDIDEALEVTDRIGVIYEGRLSEIKPRSQWTKQTIGAAMTGVKIAV